MFPVSKPMFLYAGVYENVAGADADHEAIKALARAMRSGRTIRR
jgi:hypothetical protein